jgi:ferredoxin
MKVTVDWMLCEGNGVCVAAAPEVFDLSDDDELIVLMEEPPERLRAHVDAAISACPKRALSVDRPVAG